MDVLRMRTARSLTVCGLIDLSSTLALTLNKPLSTRNPSSRIDMNTHAGTAHFTTP